mgnify:FL=1
MKQCVYLIDSLTERLGRLLAWLIPLMMLGTTSVVVMRYGFGQGMTALQESVSYLHGTVFMLGAAYTLKHGGHVRVDIFYRRFSPRTKAWVDSIGSIVFLLPLCGLILITSWDFTLNAWAIHETSVEPGGLPFVYLLKTLLPLMAINLAMQGFADARLSRCV